MLLTAIAQSPFLPSPRPALYHAILSSALDCCRQPARKSDAEIWSFEVFISLAPRCALLDPPNPSSASPSSPNSSSSSLAALSSLWCDIWHHALDRLLATISSLPDAIVAARALLVLRQIVWFQLAPSELLLRRVPMLLDLSLIHISEPTRRS